MLLHFPVAFANPIPAQDRAHSEAFLSALNALNEPCDFRAIHDRDKTVAAIPRRGTLAQLWSELCDWNNRGYGIFVTPAAMDGNGRTLDHVQAIRAHYVDLDGVNAMADAQQAASHVLPPQMQVNTSPGRAHVYWLLDQRYRDNDYFNATQRRLATLFNGDRAVVDPTRVMRLPGFLHWKADPHLVTCHALPAWGYQTQAVALAASVQHVNVIDAGTGGRHALGDAGLAAPSLDWLQAALDDIDPNDLGRGEWIKLTAAVKQAGWSLTDEPTLRAMWDGWCARYADNNVGDNDKQWRSIRDTEAGWSAIARRLSPDLRARLAGLPDHGRLPVPVPGSEQPRMFLDDGTGQRHDRLVSSEVYRIVKLDYKLPIALDTFADRIVKRGSMPWKSPSTEWSDTDTAYLRTFLQTITGKSPSTEALIEGITIVADQNAFNPLVEWLDTLQWDGVPRIDEMLSTYFKADDAALARIVSAKFLIGMVARAYDPGVKRDEVLIIEGEQGIGKSTALNILAGDEYFIDSLPNLHDKEAMQLLQGKWLVELGELAALRRSQIEDVKRFIVARHDNFRPAYGRLAVKRARTMIFAATTNASEYLKDPTGARRWWPVKLSSKIDLDGLARDRDQLFAEARLRLLVGQPFYLSPDEEAAFADVREAAEEIDPWHEPISAWLGNQPGPVTLSAIFKDALGGLPFEARDAGKARRVVDILRKCEWKQKKSGGQRSYIRSN